MEEEEEIKTAVPTSSVGEVESAGVTEHHKAEVITNKEGIANLEVRNITLVAQSSFTMTDLPNFITNNIPQTRGFNVNKQIPVTTGTIKLFQQPIVRSKIRATTIVGTQKPVK